MGLIIGQGTKSGGGGGGASSAADFMRIATLDGQGYNLFDEVKKIRKDSRASNYAVVIMGLYYQGYNSLVLKGADAYITCDGDFYEASSTDEEIIHYWHDTDSGKIDRYVAFLQKTEKQSIVFDKGGRMPRGLIVDGHCGEIRWTYDRFRFKFIDTTKNSSILSISPHGIINGVPRVESEGDTYFYLGNTLYGSTRTDIYWNGSIAVHGVKYAVLNIKELDKGAAIVGTYGAVATLETLVMPTLEKITGQGIFRVNSNNELGDIIKIKLPICQYIANYIISGRSNANVPKKLKYLILPKCTYMPKIVSSTNNTGGENLIHIEIGENFYSNLNIKEFLFTNCLLTDANDLVEDLQAHPTWSNLDQWLWNFEHLIVDKLADLSGQTTKTITLAAAPYAAITEQIRQKMSAKNWNLASA